MKDPPRVSAAIVTYNQASLIGDTVRSIQRATERVDLTLYVIDNGSTDGTADAAAGDGVQVLRERENLGFGRAHNLLRDRLDSDYHAVINPDIRLDEDVISALVEYLEAHPDVVMITPKIVNADGSEQHLPIRQPTLRYVLGGRLAKLGRPFSTWRARYTYADHPQDKPFDIEFCTGCFFVIRTEAFRRLGGFDERFFLYFEDADLARRAAKLGRVQFFPGAQATHLWERASAHNLKYLCIHLRSLRMYFSKWRNQSE